MYLYTKAESLSLQKHVIILLCPIIYNSSDFRIRYNNN